MTVPAEVIEAFGAAKQIGRNVLHQYVVGDNFTKSTCWGVDNKSYVGLDITIKSDGPGKLLLDGQEFQVPSGGITLNDVIFDQVKWAGGVATITIAGCTFGLIQQSIGAPTPAGWNVKA